MRWLIRRVLKKSKGAISYEEDVHYGDVLTIGRAADQAIFLPDLRVALNHARITLLANGQYKIESLILAGIRVDGQIVHTTTAASGAVIEIGNTRLTLLSAPQDFDGGIEISTPDKGEQNAEKVRLAKPTRLEQTGLSKRRPSWILFLVILGFGLILPMVGHFVPGFGELLRHTPLPSTASWNPGPLDAAHRFFGNDCRRCHQSAFLTVRDTACLACHRDTPAHADPAKFNLPQLGDAACRTCHQDHQGERGLIRRDPRLCTDCHANLRARTQGASQFADVRDFGNAHPEFKIDLPAWDANGRFTPQRVTWAADRKENSGLKFNHAKHLQPDGINAPRGHRVLGCADCHVADAGGAKMRPIDFASQCHDCHSLGFDPLAAGREVPHGKVSEVIYTLNEYYARVALEGGYQDTKSPAIVQERRRPGSPPLSQQQQQEALAWAREQARRVTESLFTGRACTTCHKVTPPRDADDTWHVAPVRVAGVWYADAKFTHAKHSTVKCDDCHAARQSQTASDLLIPGIGNCRACHGGADAKDRVASTCIACHDYHQSPTLRMGRAALDTACEYALARAPSCAANPALFALP
jgi:hypothetical protein